MKRHNMHGTNTTKQTWTSSTSFKFSDEKTTKEKVADENAEADVIIPQLFGSYQSFICSYKQIPLESRLKQPIERKHLWIERKCGKNCMTTL